MPVKIANSYERIINNYLENLYLEMMTLYDDNDFVMKSIYRSFEKVFIVDFEYINFLTIKDRILDNIQLQAKKAPRILKCEKRCDIDERLYLFNFNLANYFNELDNEIIISLLIHKLETTKIATLLNYKEEFILERLIVIVRWMRVHFINVIREHFVDENENELD